jgi:hypothetical protein
MTVFGTGPKNCAAVARLFLARLRNGSLACEERTRKLKHGGPHQMGEVCELFEAQASRKTDRAGARPLHLLLRGEGDIAYAAREIFSYTAREMFDLRPF